MLVSHAGLRPIDVGPPRRAQQREQLGFFAWRRCSHTIPASDARSGRIRDRVHRLAPPGVEDASRLRTRRRRACMFGGTNGRAIAPSCAPEVLALPLA